MSQSPETEVRVQRYEMGWEAINRMIREDLSWGGYERNVAHAACADGRFADISSASGLDFLDDGRSLAVLDADQDGRPDLALRARTGPQLRILLNRWSGAGAAVWILLEGAGKNGHAIGASVVLDTPLGPKRREVHAGSGFLGQSSRWLYFATRPASGSAAGALPAPLFGEVRWPGGARQRVGPLLGGRRYIIRQGEEPREVPSSIVPALVATHADNVEQRRSEAGGDPPAGALSTWLAVPLPVPTCSLPSARGLVSGSGAPAIETPPRAGRPSVLHFVSAACAACRAEARELRAFERAAREGGADLIHVLVDAAGGGSPAAWAPFLEAFPAQAPVAAATPEMLTAYNILHRFLRARRRDLAVPTTLILDGAGDIVRAHRGAISPATLASDLRQLPATRQERLALALPRPGLVLREGFRRDWMDLGNALYEAGLFDLARRCYARSTDASGGTDIDGLYNGALAASQAGEEDAARATYERILREAPRFDDARNNLAVIHLRRGRREEGLALLEAVVASHPAHAEAVLNLTNALIESGEVPRALEVLDRALSADRGSAAFWRQLGYARYRASALKESEDAYREALRLAPSSRESILGLSIILMAAGQPAEAAALARRGLESAPRDGELLNVLGMALGDLGRAEEAEAQLRAAIASAPTFDRPYTNLARLLERLSRRDEAVATLEALLKALPGHPLALQMLESLGQPRPR